MHALLAASASLLLASSASPVPGLTELARLEAQYAPVDLRVDVSKLPQSERQALARLVQAARLMDAVFLRQTWAGNASLLVRLSGAETPLGRAQLRYFLINRGPWDALDHHRPFLPGVPPKPEGGNFYPPGATKEQVSSWEASLPPEQRARASGFFTTVRASPDGTFTVVPYSEAYQGELALAAVLLREAASLTTQPTLKAYLEKRADAFLSNDYYARTRFTRTAGSMRRPRSRPSSPSATRRPRPSWRASRPSSRDSRTRCRLRTATRMPSSGRLLPSAW